MIKKDRNSRTKTVKSRIEDLWNHVRQKRKDFEAKPDTGLLPKNVTRHIHRFVNYILKGFIGNEFCKTVRVEYICTSEILTCQSVFL